MCLFKTVIVEECRLFDLDQMIHHFKPITAGDNIEFILAVAGFERRVEYSFLALSGGSDAIGHVAGH